MTGTVLKGIGGFYYIIDDSGREYRVRAQNKIRRVRLKPHVGDTVEFTPGGNDEDGWMNAILPRKNELIRPPVANIDLMVPVVATASPDPDLLLIDRLLMIAAKKNIPVITVITKADKDHGKALDIKAQYETAGIKVHVVCSHTGEGIEELKAMLAGKVHVFCGQSGAGKSTLINALYGLSQETGELSMKIERGKNTTRRCELIPIAGGGMVLDTPGFSLLEAELTEPENLSRLMPEFEPYNDKCRFSPCYHMTEPDCAVKRAVLAGNISRDRYERYCILTDEMKERWRKRYD